ncbi:hypothetical protein L208DRAFT_1381883 [Tricholoma matsutake]|nr:hypothetical protein L208DRAFT_1381883 [Tricholoma matsutake 945]
MTFTTAQKVPSTTKATPDAAHSAEAQQLLSQLRKMGISLPTTLNPALTATASGSASGNATTMHITTSPSDNGTMSFSLTDSFIVSVKCAGRKKYSTLEATLGAFQAALALDTVKLLSKD